MKNNMVLVGIVLTITGCANSHYQCGVSYGVGCKPVTDIYQELEDGTLETLNRDPYLKPGANNTVKNNSGNKIIGKGFTATDNSPVFVPPREYRIWIANWTDRNKIYHGDQYIYVYVGDGRWESSK